MSKYGDDHLCTCEMNLVSCKNDFHADSCELWLEPSFKSGEDEWDGDLGTLVLAVSPWHNAEEYVWNGDTPVCRKSTAAERTLTHETVSGVEIIGDLEQEALDAITSGDGSVDEYEWIVLPDGSYADFETRVTYRAIKGDDGGTCWVEELWDAPANLPIDLSAPVACLCTPPKTYYCHTCEVKREKFDDEWERWTAEDRKSKGAVSYSASPVGGSWSGWARCDHNMDVFRLPGRQHTNIVISAKRTHTAESTPDYGLYAYAGWDPKCVATLLPWQDYGLPTVAYERAAEAIKYAYDLACEGQTVEVGCMGGHGRTGTILACMAILSDPEMTPMGAIKWVRKVHCNEAIETNHQEWFVAWFKAWLLNDASLCPRKPVTYVSKHSKNWQAAGAAAQTVKGSDPTLPLAPSSPAVGTSTKPHIAVWCTHCHRMVHTMHNGDCPFSLVEEEKTPTAALVPYKSDGETANARRRNAKRANRRKARQQKQALRTGD